MKVRLYLFLSFQLLGVLPVLGMEAWSLDPDSDTNYEYFDRCESEFYSDHESSRDDDERSLGRYLNQMGIYREDKKGQEKETFQDSDSDDCDENDGKINYLKSGLCLFQTEDGVNFVLNTQEIALCETLQNLVKDCDESLIVKDPIPVSFGSHIAQRFQVCLQFLVNCNEAALKKYLNQCSLKEVSELLRVADFIDCEKLFEACLISLTESFQNMQFHEAFDSLKMLCLEDELSYALSKKFISLESTEHLLEEIRIKSLKRRFAPYTETTLIEFGAQGIIAILVISNGSFEIRDSKTGDLVSSLKRYTNNIATIALSSDEAVIALGTKDGSIELWDIQKELCIATLLGDAKPISSLVFSFDGKTLFSGDMGGTVKIWNTKIKTCIKTLEGHKSAVNSIAFSDAAQVIITKGDDKTLRFWNVESGICFKIIDVISCSANFALSSDGKTTALGSFDGEIRLFDVKTGACIKTLTGHNNEIAAIAFSHDNKTVASGSFDHTVRLWDVQTGVCSRVLQGHSDFPFLIAFSHDDRILASGSFDKTVKVWNIKLGTCFTIQKRCPDAISFSDNGFLKIGYIEKCSIAIWDIGDQKLHDCLTNVDVFSALILAKIARQYAIAKKAIGVDSEVLNMLPDFIKIRLLSKYFN